LKSRAKSRGDTWALDGQTITVFIPMTWKRCGGQKVITAADGSDTWALAKLRPDEALIRALARAHRWNRMLESGEFTTIAELAQRKGIAPSYMTRVLRLTELGPDLIDAILDGRQGTAITSLN
jgi:hypothetical protein